MRLALGLLLVAVSLVGLPPAIRSARRERVSKAWPIVGWSLFAVAVVLFVLTAAGRAQGLCGPASMEGCVGGGAPPGEDRSWHLLQRQYDGLIRTITHGLTKHECEFAKARATGEPATDEEKAAAAERERKKRRNMPRRKQSGWLTTRSARITGSLPVALAPVSGCLQGSRSRVTALSQPTSPRQSASSEPAPSPRNHGHRT